MCVVSMVGDHFGHEWKKFNDPKDGSLEWIRKLNELPGTNPDPSYFQPHLGIAPPVTLQEYERLKTQVESMKSLLRLAVDYDKRTGQPGCEIEEKIALLRRVAEAFKIDLDDLLK